MSNTLTDLKAISDSQASKFHNPFTEEVKKPREYKPKNDYTPLKKKTKSVEEMVNGIDDDSLDQIFDNLGANIDPIFDNLEESDENASIRAGLVSQGRKYARDHSADDDSSNEIDRAFSPYVILLNDLLQSVNKDTNEVSKDINELRMMHNGRNYQRMTELISAKTQLHNTSLQILNKLSSIEKDKFDIKNKNAKNITETDPSIMSGNILQNIFGLGHSTLLESVGGREGSSGATNGEFVDTDSDAYGEFLYNQAYPDNEETETEGDKFLKYEDRGVNMILEEKDDGTKTVHAEDSEGNIINDYPIPDDVNSLTFDINHRTNVATDQLQRKYIYRSV